MTKLPLTRTRNSPTQVRCARLEDSHDLALGAAVGIQARDAHQHAVAVHGLVRRAGGQEDVAANAFHGAIGDQESVAVAVHLEAARGELAGVAGGDVLPAGQLDQVPARRQPRQGGLEFLARAAASAQLADQLFEARARVRQPRDMLQDRLGVHVST